MKFKTVKELQDFYAKFEKMTLGELMNYIKKAYPEITITPNKGIAGQILEGIIGNAPNSSPEPDIVNLGIELKVLPLRLNSKKSLLPKERSKIKSLNYKEIVKEEWLSSSVRGKMQKVLFLLYEQPSGKTYRDWVELIFHGTLLYELKSENEDVVQEDWEGIKAKVVNEVADQISEGDSRILGACTSGTGKLIEYVEGKTAKQRSYSLKHSYLKVFYKKNKQKVKYASLNVADESVESFILRRLNEQLDGKSLLHLSKQFDVPFSANAKSGFSLLVKRILKVNDKTPIKDIEENGIVIKTIPLSPDGKVWESMSFPRFSLVDLLEESWDDEGNEDDDLINESTFKNTINQTFIFIPIIKDKEFAENKASGRKKFESWEKWKVGPLFVWTPSNAELYGIKSEWEMAKDIVEEGVKTWKVKQRNGVIQKNNLLKEKDTTYIHIRPKARDSKDLDVPYMRHTKNKVQISGQCFWLNKKFIASLVAMNS